MNKYKIKKVPIDRVFLNDKNPRLIKDAEFVKLVKSLADCPDLFEARPLLCSDRTGRLVIMGGNMRYRAALELKWAEVPVIVMTGLSEAQEREIIIKDNGSFGEWDMEALLDGWSDLPLDDWGVDLPEDWLKEIPEENKAINEEAMADTKNECPKCGFKW